jgi:hypothetical protein
MKSFRFVSARSIRATISFSTCWTNWPNAPRSSAGTRPISFFAPAISLFFPVWRVLNSASSR